MAGANVKKLARLVLALCLAAALPAFPETEPIYSFNGRIPLGIEGFRLRPSGQHFYLMASVESPELEGLYRVREGDRVRGLFAHDNTAVKFYPTRVQFRVTASAREKFVQDYSYNTDTKLNVDQLMSQLRFRVKVFHELKYRYIKPTVVENVGVPTAVTYDERIYRIGFDLGKIPIEDRLVMEVLSPNGQRLCKFHLDLL